MAITHAEERLRTLLVIWLILFTGGVIVMGAAIWVPGGAQIYTETPALAFTWIGQALLFLCSFYLFSGIRDNELTALVIAWFKLASGTTMLIFVLSHGTAAGGGFSVIGGGVLDYVMGGLMFWWWLAARRSRAQRMPLVFDIGPGVEEEPVGAASNAMRITLAGAAAIFGVTAAAIFVVTLSTPGAQTSTFEIAAGNAVAAYAAMGLMSVLAAESPRRRPYALDIVVLISLFSSMALILWTIRFPLSPTLQTWFMIGAAVHLVVAVSAVASSVMAARVQRPTRFFGAWLHRAFEKFAEVMVKGDIEVVTPRELADTADTFLAKISSPRIGGVKMAMAAIELGSLARFHTPLSRLGRLEREEYLTSVFQQGSRFFRDLIKIKQLIFLLYYSDERTYKEIGYVHFRDRERYQQAEHDHQLPGGPVDYPPVVHDRVLETDVCVIGSGAGGAVVAARLAEAGKRVVILEEGPFLKRDRITDDERGMPLIAYREGGLQLTLDFDMYVLQGRCVGGSTFVNNAVCFDVPHEVLAQWEDLGAKLNRDKLNESFRRIRADLNIMDLEEHQPLLQKGSLKFMDGCRALGLPGKWFDVNMNGCLGCGNCTTGCAYEKRTSMDRSYIPRALRAGAVLVSDCKAIRITKRGSRADTVECRRTDGKPLTVKAKQIVVAGGAINSSLLLLRSGIGSNVGTRLSFNAGSWVFAEFPEPIDAFDGIQMCTYLERPRYFLETIAMSPGAFAASMPGWFRDHFDRMRRYRYFAVAGALVGTEPVGRIRPSSLPVVGGMLSPIDFDLSVSDLRRLREGVRAICRVFLKAGAVRVIPATFSPLEFMSPAQVNRLDEVVIEPDDIAFGSAHPQGGNPMSDDRNLGVVDTGFRVHNFENLFVCDASVFPTSIGVNPQLTVMAMADYASSLIAAAK